MVKFSVSCKLQIRNCFKKEFGKYFIKTFLNHKKRLNFWTLFLLFVTFIETKEKEQ